MIDMQKRIWQQDAEAIGEAIGVRNVINGMIKQNIPTEVIAKAANVTPAEVEAIKNSMEEQRDYTESGTGDTTRQLHS